MPPKRLAGIFHHQTNYDQRNEGQATEFDIALTYLVRCGGLVDTYRDGIHVPATVNCLFNAQNSPLM